MTLKVWAQWSGCCVLALLVMSADAVAQTQNGKTWTLESAMKKQKSATKEQSKRSLVVTLSGHRNIQDVVRDLKASGLEAPEVLDAIGVVTGSAASNSVAKLRKVPGVKDVSQDHKIDIGPPDAPVSW
jgi:hypothetical protein